MRLGFRALGGFVSVLVPLACADLLGLEPGVLVEDVADAGSTGQPGQGGSSLGAGGDGEQAGAPAVGGSSSAGSSSTAGGAGAAQGGSEPGGTAGADPGGAGQGPCSDGSCVECAADMVQAASGDGYPFCIDVAEVTNEQYLVFTEQHTPESVTASAACSANPSFEPDDGCDSALRDVPSRKLPVVCVDYCDAEAYCSAQGKRLCGRVGGTMNTPSDDADFGASEWYAACAGPGEALYSTGDAQSSAQCNGSGYAPSDMGPRDVETMVACEGGVSGLYNMSGNVAEWTWSCSSTSAGASCSTRGGSYVDGGYELRCAAGITMSRLSAAQNVGFRCCADLAE